MKFINYEMDFQKRTTPLTGTSTIFVRIASIAVGLGLLGIFFFLIGVDPIDLYLNLIDINIKLFPSTLAKFIPLLIISIGLALPFKARIDNIGAEGQYIMGGLAATATAFAFPTLPSFVLIPLMFINGFIFGAIWALPVVFFRAKGGFQGADVVVSFLLVFPALYLQQLLVSTSWRDPETGFAFSKIIPSNGQIPKLDFKIPIEFLGINWNFSTIHATIFLVIILTILVYFFLFRKNRGIPLTKIAYEIEVIGKNRIAGQIAGMSFFKVILFTMIISGGFAGIAGVGEIAGNQLRVTTSSPGYGFTAIAVAYLGGLHPIGIVVSSLFFAGLIVGGNVIKLTKGLPGTALDLFSGVVLFFVLVAEFFFRYTIKVRKVHD